MQNENQNTIIDELSKEYHSLVRTKTKPRIMICTPEITELPEGMGNAANLVSAKGGGLGDISASLIRYLADNKDFELHVVLPKYDNRIKHMARITNRQIDRLAIILSGKGIHLINDSSFSYIFDPYEENKYHTRIRRAMALNREVINYLLDSVEPDIVHCNDWMTALIPAAAKAKGIKSLFTLHNIFTEKQTLMDIELSGMKPFDFAQWLYFEDFPGDLKKEWEKIFTTNKVDLTASGIYAADIFNTVSETFLDELVNNYFDDIVPPAIYRVIREKWEQGRAYGILNAPNDTIHPEISHNIINYHVGNAMEKRLENKIRFQKMMELPAEPEVPLFFWPNRLYYQKAPEILIDNISYFLSKYEMQIAVVANGDSKLEKKLADLTEKQTRLSYKKFNEELSGIGKAAADFILMPSRYEPCGLPQMEAIRFGTLPIVRATGGLKDTIQHLDWHSDSGNGFVFEIADKAGLEYGIKEAISFYKLPHEIKKKQIQRIMLESLEKYNLKNTAEKYLNLYEKLLQEG